ncbi:hypothetical protein MRX96_048679 [Rhipicephalus microplus]
MDHEIADARKASVTSAATKSSSSRKSASSSKFKDGRKVMKRKKSPVPEVGKDVSPESPPQPKAPEARAQSRQTAQAVSMMEKYVEVSAKAEARDRFHAKVIMLLVMPAIATFLVLLAALIYVVTREKPRLLVDTCRNDACAAFGEELHAAINWSVNPCEDFHAFVCGGWDDPQRQTATAARMVAAALDQAIEEVKADLARQGSSPQHSSKAAQFFESCVIADTQKHQNLEEFADFRQSLGLVWPERNPSDDTHPLDIMVNLAINWEMNFFFDLGVVAMRQSTSLLVSRGRMDDVWEEKPAQCDDDRSVREIHERLLRCSQRQQFSN